VNAFRRPPTADPDFDPPPSSTVRLRDFDPLEHQRLVVNPFLAVFDLVAAVWLLSTTQSGAIAGIAGLLLLPLLVQYHCLDCGHTGLYSRRERHACPRVVARWSEGKRSRSLLPTAWVQMVIWVWLLGSVAVLLAVVGLG
jgi:hypothetical protein